MLGTVEKIGEPCQTPFNAGYLTHLYLIRTDELVYVHAPSGNSLHQPLSAVGIKTGAVITEFIIKPKTATFSESSGENADGRSYNAAITVPLKGSANNVTDWIFRNGKHRFLILMRDTMGNCYLAGTKENGARIAWARQVANTSLQQINITLVNWFPIQFIPSVDVDNLFPDREFDYSFDLSFS